jgi:CBS domain containing-hemolysin-like protein
MIGYIFLTFLFVLANAFCVAAEFAIVKVRVSQLRIKAKSGSKLALLSESITHNLDSYLSATQLGITLASLGLGWIGEPIVAKLIYNFMELLNITISAETAYSIALPTAFILISFLHIVFGELAPKSIAILYPENVTIALSIPLRILHFIFKPFIIILNGTANSFIKLIGFEPPKGNEFHHSSEEIRLILEESSKSGIIEDSEHKLLDNIFDFADTPVKQIMVPRNNIDAVGKEANSNEIWETIIDGGYSRIPIYDKDIDNIIGIVYGKDLLVMIKNPTFIILDDIMRKPLFVNEDDKISDVLKRMQRTHIQLAIVYNEFGGTAGLITIEDILEEIVGEIQDEHDEEATLIESNKEGFWEVDASMTINDVNDFIQEKFPESDDYETIGGYIISTICRIPNVNEVIKIGDYSFTIIQGTNRKIERVKIDINRETPK